LAASHMPNWLKEILTYLSPNGFCADCAATCRLPAMDLENVQD